MNNQIWDDFVRWLLTSGLSILLILFIVIILNFVLNGLLSRLKKILAKRTDEEGAKRIETLVHISKHMVRIVIFVLGSLVILSEMGIDMAPILTTVGVFGLAISFGAQSLVKDLISGFFLLAENQVRLGDVIQVGDMSGTVEAITIRTITLRDISGNVHVIPNGKVEEFTNMTKEYSRYVLDIGVAYREDVEKVMDVLRDEGEKMASDPEFETNITEPFDILGVQDFGDSAVVIRTRITTRPLMQWSVAREFRKRIKKRFDAEGIEIPFPHRTVYWGETKVGKQQGLKVKIENKKAS